jgi:hypothetical protein
METKQHQQDTVTATVPIARKAIREFILEQRLPRPIGVRRPRPSTPGIPIDVSVEDIDSWVEATAAEYLGAEALNHEGLRYARTSWVGRVPSPVGDVAVVLRIVQRIGLPSLTMVPGGGAA